MTTESQQQEWTPEWLANFGSAENWLEQVCAAHNASLAAERQRREQAERDYRISLNAEKQITDGLGKLNNDLHQQLLSTQAAIEELHDALVAASSEFNLAGTEATARKINEALEVYPDLSLLHRHDAEVRKPFATANLRLVEALKKARETIHALHFDVAWGIYEKHSPEIKMIDDALAKVKEGK